MEGDVSNKTLVVLVVLTVIISILSTLVVLNEVFNVSPQTISQHASAGASKTSSTGIVQMQIKPDPIQTTNTGKVTMKIIE
jgi:hypothetical protein